MKTQRSQKQIKILKISLMIVPMLKDSFET